MPIVKAAVDAYLNRQVEPKTWFKQLKPLEVEEELSYINPPPKFTAPLFTHQKICFLMGAAYPESLILTDLGTGKTSVALELLSYFYNNKFIRRAIILTPTNEVAEGWEDEINKWGFTLPFIRLTDKSSRRKWETLAEFDDGLIIGTFVGISIMTAPLVEIKNKDKKQHKINKELITKLTQNVDAVVYDQSTCIGNSGSLSFKVCKRISDKAQIRFGLAGRAFGRDPFMLWSQLMLTDKGKALGTNPMMFREAFWRKKFQFGNEWVLRKRRQDKLSYFLSASSIRYSIDECVQLPPKSNIIKECEFPEENWSYYDQAKEDLIHSKGNFTEVKNSFLRMRQISSGFIGFKDDETGEKAQIEFQDNVKLDLLMQLIGEVPEDQKMIIFHEFTWSGSRICQELAKQKLQYGWLWGGTKDWTGIKSRFNDDPDFRILVANHKKGSMGLNLQSASYVFFYESPVSAIARSECEGRIYRTGQTRKCFIYDLVLKNSVDETILDFHRTGNNLWKTLVENPNKVLRILKL